MAGFNFKFNPGFDILVAKGSDWGENGLSIDQMMRYESNSTDMNGRIGIESGDTYQVLVMNNLEAAAEEAADADEATMTAYIVLQYGAAVGLSLSMATIFSAIALGY
jgi:hypothetical protein